MLALSTSWNADGRFTPRGLLAAVRECGVAALELSYSHTAADLAGIVACCRESSVRVVSVHNFCPCPEKVAAGRSRSEAFLLSSSDETERRMAVEATRRSIATAASLGVKALILHLGRVEVPCRTRELIELYRRGKQGERRYAVMKDRMREERSRHAQPFIDRVVRSLEELCPAARDAGVSLCVENRYYYREIPGLDDIRGLMGRFMGAPVAYWHDIGHGEVMQSLGLATHAEYLEEARGRISGFHVHDVLQCADHLPPGRGTVDYKPFTPYWVSGVLMVIELSPFIPVAEVKAGIERFRSISGTGG